MRRVGLLVAFVLAVASPSWATNYYVDYADGLDANNGTSTATPKKNPPATLAAGDNVYFKGGVVFDNQITVTHSGTAESPIIYDGNSAGDWGTGRAVISGDNTRVYGVYGSSKSYVQIKHFEIRDITHNLSQNWMNGGVFLIGTSSGVVIDNNYVHNVGYWNNDCANPATTGGKPSGSGILIRGTNGSTISNNTVTETGATGITLAGANHSRVTGNSVYGYVTWGLELNTDYSPGAVDNNTFANNTVHDIYQHDAGYLTGACDPHTDGIFIRQGGSGSPHPTGTILDGNRLYNDATFDEFGGTALIFLSYADNSIVRNNVLINPHSYAALSVGWTSTGTKIYNNTIYAPRTSTIPVQLSTINSGSDTELRNNILVGSGPSVQFIATTFGGHVSSDNNIFTAPSGGKQVHVVGPPAADYTAAQWRALGYDLSTTVADNAAVVGFDNIVGYPATSSAMSLALTEGSIAIDNGMALPISVTLDIAGTDRRPQGTTWDIGAYEYASGTPADNTAPTVPGNLTATATGYTTGTISWDASTDAVGVAGYLVYRDGALVGTTAASPFSDSGLTVATAYSYTVAAYDAAGNVSAATDAAVATTFAYPVMRPAILQGTWQ